MHKQVEELTLAKKELEERLAAATKSLHLSITCDSTKITFGQAQAEQDAAVTEQDAAVTEQDGVTKSQSYVVYERNNAIAARNNAIAARDNAIAARDAAVAARDAAVAERDTAVAERDAAILARDNDNVALRAVVARQVARLRRVDKLGAAVDNVKENLEQIVKMLQ